MSNKMLIDATHPEETRVVVVRDKRVEDFDFEAASKKPLRGNIYLAKVTRVEPSLQAAFVEYGGNRHGFLAFSEIHPDYYQIPQSDRAALIAEEREADEEEEERPRKRRGGGRRKSSGNGVAAQASEDPTEAGEMSETATDGAEGRSAEPEDASRQPAENADENSAAAADDGDVDEPEALTAGGGDGATGGAADGNEEVDPHPRYDARPADDGEATTASDSVSSDEAPSALGRAKTQAEEVVDADVEAAAKGDRGDAGSAPEPAAADGDAGAQLSEASSASARGVPSAEDVPQNDGDAAPPTPRRRRRTTQKSADGLADPQVSDDAEGDSEDALTSLGNQDVMEEIPERKRRAPRRNYKIQEVIKRRQILLVQVVKEERGTKGAALTTYLSLAGRYAVLMPNTDRGGGVSRKITDASDRKRLKGLVAELDVPEGMGIILRTAGAARTKTEIRRDFEYLLRLWESVRDLTLKSIAPELVYEEGNLVKRSIRDLYSKEIDEVLVSGDNAYREAKDFMRMLMPSHAKNVKAYREPTPIFTKYAVEAQLDAMFSPQVTLPSKGYIVINQTEALVAIDVNSGRSTKEHSIEDTALKTNLEAADEVARQLRLRDLAGLIVIDFIDMDEKRNNRAVEKRLKDALKLDRSRIQLGRISAFGLMEMSRQRIRQGMVETSMVACPACAGTGHVRSTQSVALHCLRALEEHLLKHSDHHLTIKTSAAVALYILNQKRAHLNALEERFGLEIGVDADEALAGQHLEIVSGAAVERSPGEIPPTAQLSPDAVAMDDDEDDEEADETQTDDVGSGERASRRRRRKRRRDGDAEPRDATSVEASDEDGADSVRQDSADDDQGEERKGRRRRGRRGGRRHRREGEGEVRAETGAQETETSMADREDGDHTGAATSREAEDDAASDVQTIAIAVPQADDGDTTYASGAGVDANDGDGARAAADGSDGADRDGTDATVETDVENDVGAESATGGEVGPGDAAPQAVQPNAQEGEDERAPEQKSDARPRRVGWWQRRSFF